MEGHKQQSIGAYMTITELWEDFGNTPINDDEQLDQDWLQFKAGTDRFVVCYWFENTFEVSVASLMGLDG